jgi:hypothetical protein
MLSYKLYLLFYMVGMLSLLPWGSRFLGAELNIKRKFLQIANVCGVSAYVRASACVYSQPTHLTRPDFVFHVFFHLLKRARLCQWTTVLDKTIHILAINRLETYRENLHRTKTRQLLRFWRKTSGGNAITLWTYPGNKLLHSLVICLDSFSRTAIKNTATSSKRGSDDPLASPCTSGGSKCLNILSLFSVTAWNCSHVMWLFDSQLF